MSAPTPIHDSQGLTNSDITAHGVTAPPRAESDYSSDEEKGGKASPATISVAYASNASSEEELLKV
jgi:hypothetical protein